MSFTPFKIGGTDPSQLEPITSTLPRVTGQSRVAFIGGFPTADDMLNNEPFSSGAGHLLKGLIQAAGLSSLHSMFSYVCRYQPPHNNIKRFSYSSPEMASSRKMLKAELDEFKPNIIVLLGTWALSTAGINHDISSYRGSLFVCTEATSPLFGYKCIGTFEPMQVIKKQDWQPLLKFDLERAKEESFDPSLTLPERNCEIHLSAQEVVNRMEQIPDGATIGMDIEGYVDRMTCCSIATDPNNAFIIAFTHYDRAGEKQIWRAFARLMGNPKVYKVLQNGLYDAFILAWSYNILIRGFKHDTMLSGWEIFPELPKSLATQTSIWTREPYYKADRKIQDDNVHHRYCCKDSMVTLEISNRHLEYMEQVPAARKHYDMNMELLSVLLYMELRGFNYDSTKAVEYLRRVQVQMRVIQARINARRVQATGNPTATININSPKQMCSFFYDELFLPVQHPKKTKGFGYDRTKRTANVDACLKLIKEYDDPTVHDVLAWRKLEKFRQTLEKRVDTDGRMRGSYNPVGTDTGRLSCSGATTGNGDNLQTITKKLRVLFAADKGCESFQLDLAGADGWTVAAHAKALGDSTMFDDYLYGMKPAKIIALMYHKGSEVSRLPREELKKLCADIGETGETAWLYAASKMVQHGTSYMMGVTTMSANILKRSYKDTGTPIYVSAADCRKLQALFYARYPGIKMWQTQVRQQLTQRGYIACASGHVRSFMGDRRKDATLKVACSQEPQHNTTYATNLAALRLWKDPENRRPDGTLIVEPLHQVHDALVGQWKKPDREFACRKLKEWFNNELTIAGLTFVIPYDGEFGPSWGAQLNPIA